ncbi:nucleoside hydrolase [Proteocatella sphenisci]|uniref:nucleoside hydrolase n=1 Tax=Proteocatella sphenisci TaxID=181070 RepID=UPI0004B9BF48|nr:nucleoside hydrolase [Proteocatella sphenisci]
MKILFDCDNTFGVDGCDVDDGLALLYLLGMDAEIMGISATYGNSDLDTVFLNTELMIEELGLDHIPLLRGGAFEGDYKSEASDFLADMAERYRGEIYLLATGSLTNVYGAFLKDRRFFENLAGLCLMGGITDTLYINGKVMNELNFSCDSPAALGVIREAKNLSIVTGNNCLKAFFSHEGHRARLGGSKIEIARYIDEKTSYWYDCMKKYDIDGFYNWDVVSAAYIMKKELFEDSFCVINPDEDSMKSGRLLGNGAPVRVNLPIIKDSNIFEDEVYRAYRSVDMN